ncbi:hypothetical protein [Raoultella ornithinolytica]|nr:hypothetical protein [Raoultella ornithinolytica]QYE31815.1 hypothetical protein IRT34_08070 [Raoultella ornithinolytica]
MLTILPTIPCLGLGLGLGLPACSAVGATPLMDWIMSPSSGQAIIWC